MKSKKIILGIVFVSGIFFLFRGSSVSAAPCAGNCVYTWGEEVGTCDSTEIIDTSGQCPLGGSFNTEGTCCIKKSEDPTSGQVCYEDKGVVGGRCYNGGITGCMGIGPGLALTGEAGVKDCPSGQICCKTEGGNPGGGTTTPNPPNPPNPPTPGSGDTGGLVPCKDDCTLCHIVVGFKRIFDWLMGLLLVATTLVVTLAGVFYLVSTGSKTMMDKAKKALTYALTAFVLGMACWLIVNIIMIMVGFKNPMNGNWWEFSCDTTQTTGPTSSGGSGSSGSGSSGSTNYGTGCGAVVANINAMNGWTYTQNKDPSKGPTRMDPGYGDCSSTTQRAYKQAGCGDPGGDTATMYAKASQFTGAGNIKAGDALVRMGHVGICLVDGCAQIMGANSTDGIHPSSGSSMLNNPSIKVIKASDYCPASSC